MLSQAPKLPLIGVHYNCNYSQRIITVHLLCVGSVLSLLYVLSRLDLMEVGAFHIPISQIGKLKPKEVK